MQWPSPVGIQTNQNNSQLGEGDEFLTETYHVVVMVRVNSSLFNRSVYSTLTNRSKKSS